MENSHWTHRTYWNIFLPDGRYTNPLCLFIGFQSRPIANKDYSVMQPEVLVKFPPLILHTISHKDNLEEPFAKYKILTLSMFLNAKFTPPTATNTSLRAEKLGGLQVNHADPSTGQKGKAEGRYQFHWGSYYRLLLRRKGISITTIW